MTARPSARATTATGDPPLNAPAIAHSMPGPKRGFARLPKPEQGALVKAAETAEKRGWEMSKEREKQGDETLAKNGMSVAEPSPELKAELAKIGQQMAAEWQKTAGPDGAALMKAYHRK